jgi:hypothetical protein
MAATGLLGVNPYYKGTELDVSKPVNLAIQLHQKEEAKKEALDKYFMDYEKSLNSAGMRTQDQDVFLKKLAENKQYYLQNRDKILNPGRYGAEAQSEYMSKYKDILSDINRSKQLAANGKVLATAVTDATKNNRTIPKEITDAIYNNQLSIGDTRHVDFDPVNFDAYDKHDEGKYKQAIYSNIKPSESLPIPHKDENNHTLFYETKNEIGKNALPEIENSVDSELRKNRGLVDVVKDISTDENKLNNLAKIYNDFTGGTKKMDPKSLHDIATAYTIAIRPNAVVKYTDPKEDADYRRLQGLYDQEAMVDYRENKRLGDVHKGNYNNLVDLVEQAKQTPKSIFNKETNQNETWYQVPMTKAVQSQFTTSEKVPVKNNKGEEIGQKVIQKEVDNVLYNPRTKQWIGYYQNLDVNGNPTKNFEQKILNPRDIAKTTLKGETTAKDMDVAINASLKGLYGPTPAAPATPAATKQITVVLNGTEGSIPEDQWAAFKKKYPNAKRK